MKYYLIVALLTVGNLYGQGTRLKFGDEEFANKNYDRAKEFYLDFLSRSKDSSSVYKKLGICYDELNDFKEAYKFFKYGVKNENFDEDCLKRLIYVSIQNKDYQEAEKYSKDYMLKYGEENLSQNMKLSQDFDKIGSNRYGFNVLDSSLSSSNSEIGVSYFKDNTLLVAKNQRKELLTKRTDLRSDAYFYNLYLVSKNEEGNKSWEYVKIGNKKGNRYNDGPASLDNKTNEIYFTRSYFKDGVFIEEQSDFLNLKLFKGNLDDKNNLINVTLLSINKANVSMGHPSVSKDGNWLYFASNMPGGYGGVDIYKSRIGSNGELGEPINLGELINTIGDEMFPFVHTNNELLFFSSDGHPGIGGLDNFVAKLNSSLDVTAIENLGTPINSVADDFSFTSNGEQSQGYFCSRRNATDDDNIYGFTQAKEIIGSNKVNFIVSDYLTNNEISVLRFDLKNLNSGINSTFSEPINGIFSYSDWNLNDSVIVKLKKDGYYQVENRINLGNSNDTILLHLYPQLNTASGVVDSRTQEKIEIYSVQLESPGGELLNLKKSELDILLRSLMESNSLDELSGYNLVYSSQGYLTEKISLNQYIDNNRVDNTDIKNINLIKVINGQTDLTAEYDLNPIYFDLNSSVIRTDAKIVLNKIIKVLKDNPDISIDLNSHTDSRSSNEYNKWLSQRRAVSSMQYIIENGISPARITAIGKGEEELVITDKEILLLKDEISKESAHQKNRRTEFIVVVE